MFNRFRHFCCLRIDHRTLLTRTGNMFGVSGSVSLWLESYLSGRSSYVRLGERQSTIASSSVGVPQGSVLGPILFSMYIAPIAKIAAAFGVCIHQYADDTQLYKFTAKEGGSKTLVMLKNCTDAISDWMLPNGLALNPSKSEVIEFGTAQALHKSNMQDFNVAGSVIAVSDQIKSLGVVLDKRLSFDAQVDRTCKVIQCNARSFRHIRNFVPDILARTVASSIVPAWITATLYSPSLFCITSLSCLTRS